MIAYKSVPQNRHSGNLRGTETIVTTKLRVLSNTHVTFSFSLTLKIDKKNMIWLKYIFIHELK